MVIDTVLLKASYDMCTEDEALESMVRKLADDKRRGKDVQTLKMARFPSNGWDAIKFNFPVCGNLSATDLMTIYAGMEGFDTYVVGNHERGRRTETIRKTLGLKNVHFVPEVKYFDPAKDVGLAQEILSFTHTQREGYKAIPDVHERGLILEVAGDQPLLYDLFGQAMDLSISDADFAMNLNAVSRMQERVPSFKRNGYDLVTNSRGEEVWIKENNNFAQTAQAQQANELLFGTIYGNRNGGRYFGPIVRQVASSAMGNLGAVLKHSPSLLGYARRRVSGKNLKALSYSALEDLAPVAFSGAGDVHLDATNEDLFACWDLDGLNNDFAGYKKLFDRNFDHLENIMPYAEEVYKVHDALEQTERVMTQKRFGPWFNQFVFDLDLLLSNGDALRDLGVPEEDISAAQNIQVGMGIGVDGMLHASVDDVSLMDLELHLQGNYLPEFHDHREEYMSLV